MSFFICKKKNLDPGNNELCSFLEKEVSCTSDTRSSLLENYLEFVLACVPVCLNTMFIQGFVMNLNRTCIRCHVVKKFYSD